MNIPQHVAIIMDGNRRWAQERRLPEQKGHEAGVKTVDDITEACARIGIKALTLYTFSTENWKRSKASVDALFLLLERSLSDYFGKIKKNNIRFNAIGRISELPGTLGGRLKKVMEETSANSGMVLNLALNYGGRQEIVDAVRAVFKKSREENLDISSLDEETLGKFLYTGNLCDPDMIIRTGGEMRLSNFLLWQAAYSEIYVTDVLWPDFDSKELEKALDEYAKRKRNFGK